MTGGYPQHQKARTVDVGKKWQITMITLALIAASGCSHSRTRAAAPPHSPTTPTPSSTVGSAWATASAEPSAPTSPTPSATTAVPHRPSPTRPPRPSVTAAPISPSGPALSPTGATYFVSADGSDSNPGSLAAPWRTVVKGLTSLLAGDWLYLRSGVYAERIQTPGIQVGTPSRPILVAAYPGERPVIKGLLWMHGPSYWTFDGVNVTWDPNTGSSSEHMVKMIGGMGWTFKNAEVWGARSFAAILIADATDGSPSGWSLSGNCVHDTYPSNDTSQDHLIYVNSGVNAGRGTIEHNLLFRASNGSGIKLGGASATSGGAANVTVAYNTIYNTGQSVTVAWSSHDNTVYRNILDRVRPGASNVRGYELTGGNNDAHDNVGFLANSFIQNDSGYTAIADTGGNRFPVDPHFDSASGCGSFHPSAGLNGYGKWGGA